jgi:thioredoxin reductase (NADPH)
MENTLDVVIIGAGPAGLSAAIYAKRAMLKFVVLEKFLPGGGIANTFELENYLGVGNVTGLAFAEMMTKHVNDLGIDIQMEDVQSVQLSNDIKKIVTNRDTYFTKNVVIATGASSKKLNCIGESEFLGRGVSNCATCDGFLYKDKTVMVVGGGDVAVEDAIYLSRMVKKVYLVHRRDELRAVKSLQERVFDLDNVEILWHHELKEIKGEGFVQSARVVHNQTNEYKEIAVDGVFIAVGYTPNSQFISDDIGMDSQGWIHTDQRCETKIKGVYAVGDIRDTILRQVATAVSDGAIAISEISKSI